MSDTQVLLSRIAALRQRLEQARDLSGDLPSTDGPSEKGELGGQSTERSAPGALSSPSFRHLERDVADGLEQTILLDATLRQFPPPSSIGQPPLFLKELP